MHCEISVKNMGCWREGQAQLKHDYFDPVYHRRTRPFTRRLGAACFVYSESPFTSA